MYLNAITLRKPDSRVPLEALQADLGLSRSQLKVFTKIHGIESVLIDSESPTAYAMVDQVLRQFVEENPNEVDRIGMVFYCHTIQTVAPFPRNVVGELLSKYRIQAPGFSLTMQNCASSLLALDLAHRYVRRNPERTVLILTGEKAFTPTVQLIPGTSVMGEAGAAVLVSGSGDRDRYLGFHSKILGQFAGGVQLKPADLRAFDEQYIPTLVEVIDLLLAKVELTPSDITTILPHNINLSSWRKFVRASAFEREQIFLENVPHTGHCFCTDTFLNYVDAVRKDVLRPGNKYLMVSVGLGATFAAAAFER